MTSYTDEADRYFRWLDSRLRESRGIAHDREAALRMVAALCAVEAPDYLPQKLGQRTVARIHLVARRLAAHNLRLTYDGDRYYVTFTAPADAPAAPPGDDGRVTETLRVLGRAAGLSELATVVERITGRTEDDCGCP